nr:receptor-like serine/threonine-protein kinase At2g45590 [Ipomoea trifida]
MPPDFPYPPPIPFFPAATPPPSTPHRSHSPFLPSIVAASLALALFLLFAFIYRKISRKRTVPTDLKSPLPPHQFSYSALRRATNAFSASKRLGQGGFGSVYKGVLPSGQEIAVKLMEASGSLQGEREFQNELSIASKIDATCCPHVVSILGFSDDRRRSKDDEGGEKKQGFGNVEENGSIVEGNETVMREEVVVNVDQSPPESCCIKVVDGEVGVVSPVGETPPPSEGFEKASLSEGVFDGVSMDSGISKGVERRASESGRDWWWKQDNVNGGSESGRIKDYVMEWIGSEIKKERPKKDWIASTSAVEDGTKVEQKKHKKKLEWWASLDEEKIRKQRKNRKPREWWKEEFCEELTKKKKRAVNDSFSGEFRIGRRSSQDFASGDVPKSGGVTSTPSMRGTVCYIAPEYGGGGQLSQKCDVYSFGVLLLVLVSGRRPLQVTASPMSEFERANLVSWARHLAHSGKLLDLVDPNIQSLDQEQALLCITIALLCLQRSPNKRPTMKEIVGMLCGESEPPPLPFEFSPSPPSNFPFKSRRKPR